MSSPRRWRNSLVRSNLPVYSSMIADRNSSAFGGLVAVEDQPRREMGAHTLNRVRRRCAECGADGGLQISRPRALFTERVIEPAYLVQQTRARGESHHPRRRAHRPFAAVLSLGAFIGLPPEGGGVSHPFT